MVLGCEMFIKQPILLNVNTEKKNQLRSLQAGDLQLKTVYESNSVATAQACCATEKFTCSFKVISFEYATKEEISL